MKNNNKKPSSKAAKDSQGQVNLVESTVREASVPKLAHEFRTRLSIIRGALDNVVDGVCGPIGEEQANQLRLAVESVDRMSDLVEDLMASVLDRAGTMRLNIMDVPLQPLIKTAVDSMRSAAFKEGVTLMSDVHDKSLAVRCDPAKIEQVLINLFRNAIKFTSRGGSVTTRIHDRGSKVAVSVVDTGVGIPESKMKKLFDMPNDIADLKDARGGFRYSGLGLIIVKEIIDAHSGKITVDSEIGKGATFTFTLKKT